jgi:hypothetical protein
MYAVNCQEMSIPLDRFDKLPCIDYILDGNRFCPMTYLGGYLSFIERLVLVFSSIPESASRTDSPTGSA